MEKFIFDPTCGGRTIWFNKKHPNCLYSDKRILKKGVHKHRPEFSVEPDVLYDFTNLRNLKQKFKLIVWDPPHLQNLNEQSHFAVKYGSLQKETWPYELNKGFSELWDHLENYGILIFKWSSREIPLKKILKLFKQQPLFGHTTGSKSTTYWITFMKIPKAIK